ncbi:DUF748 domain-containing protein [Oceanobacter mangrovi]|uniref:DUF748 domain-containing protein n=1 Tax=Oceanobacter mangrovi TaxID=2862510 RepID=UPI001C8EF0A0|nr:DUF748 domain-containing protein [Oceanobacter mangrovi]
MSADSANPAGRTPQRPSRPPVTGQGRGIGFWIGRSLLVLLLLVIVLVPVIRYLGPPLAISWLQKWYAEQGDGYQLKLADWQLSLWQGTFSLAGLELIHPDKGDGKTSLDSLALDINTGKIKDRDLEVESLALVGLSAKASLNGEQLEVAGLSLPLGAETDAAPAASATDKSPESWRIAVDKLELADFKLGWQQPGVATRTSLQRLSLADFDSTDNDNIPLVLDLSVDELVVDASELMDAQASAALLDQLTEPRPLTLNLQQPFEIRWQGDVTDWQKLPGVSGDLQLGSLQLDALAGIRAGFGSMNLQQLQANSSAQSLRSLLLQDLQVGADRDGSVQNWLALQQLQLNELAFDGVELKAGKQLLSGLAVNAQLQDGRLPGLPLQLIPQASAADAAVASSDTADQPEDSEASSDAAAGSGTVSAGANQDSAERLIQDARIAGVELDDFSLAFGCDGIELVLSSPQMRTGVIDSALNAPIDLDGSLQVDKLSVSKPQTLDLLQPLNFSWQGQLLDWRRQPQLTGDVNLQNLKVKLEGQPELSFEQLSLAGISADRSVQTVAELVLDGLDVAMPASESAAIRQQGSLLSLRQYRIPKIYFDGRTFSTGVQSFSGLVARVTRLQDGRIAGLPVQSTAGARANGGATEDVAGDGPVIQKVNAKPDVVVQVDGVELASSEASSKIYWTDYAVKPDHKSVLSLRQLTVGRINSDELLNDSKTRVPVTALAGLDQYNEIRFEAQMGLWNGLPEGQYKLNIDSMNLLPFSPYVVNAIGYKVKKGMLEVKSDVTVTQGQMNGNARIRLQNSEFEPENEDTIARVSKQISMPVETALSVLKDDNNNMKIDVPIKGPIDDPDIGINDVLRQVTKTAVRSATLYYLQQAFQPYGTLISLASLAGDQLFAIRLDPLQYEPGVAELTAEQQDYLKKVAKTMTSKTDLELQVCPFVSPDEVTQQGDAWPQLADARANNVKAWFVGQKDEKGRNLTSRISLCAAAKGKAAKVEMGF